MQPPRASDNPILPFLLLVCLSVVVRVVTAEYVDIGGDNIWRWVAALDLHDGLGLQGWTHHNMRWSIVLPLWGAVELFGSNPVVYYVLPVLAASLGTGFVYLIGRQLHGSRLGVVAALLVIAFPQMAQTGSQNWPSVYQFFYAAVSMWAILAWHRDRRWPLLVVAAVFFFLCWGARTSGIYYLPGLLLLIWLPSRDFRAVLLFCCVLGVCVGLEWGYFWHDTGNPFGRIGIIKGATKAVATTSWPEYLFGFLKLTKLRGLMPIFILTLLASVCLAGDRDARVRAMSFLHIIFMFLLLYMVSGFDPIRLAQPIGARYWCAVAPFGLMLLLLALFRLGRLYPATARVLTGILFAAFIAFSAKKIPAHNAMAQTADDNAVLRPVFEARQPVLLRWEPWSPNWIEARLYDLAGVRKERKTDKSDVLVSMERGMVRALGLYAPTREQLYVFDRSLLHPVDDLTYVYVPAGTSPGDAPGAEIYFDRKGARAKAL
jgi:hypothetical protein